MYLIKERIRDAARFGKEYVPEVGSVDWGKLGENVIEVNDRLGQKLIRFGGNKTYREIKFPKVVIVAPAEVVIEEELTPLVDDTPPEDYVPIVDYPQSPVVATNPKRTRSPNGTRKTKKR